MVKRLERLYEIVEAGAADDPVSRGYDFIGVACILINLLGSILATFDGVESRYGGVLDAIEIVTVLFFTADYIFRLLTARYLRPHMRVAKATRAYVFSFTGIVDLLSFLPFYLPIFFPAGMIAFRMFRLVRIFRLFRVGAYYDSLNVITEVLKNKKQQLLSSVFIILILMLASSLCMYSIEHEAQPEVFRNAFSGIWWATSTLLTIGYGDIYPITTVGKIFSIILTFLGVGLVAIPTGIISAGFVEQYASLKRKAEFLRETDVNFIKFRIMEQDAWTGKRIQDIGLPHSSIIAVVKRGRETIVPRGDVKLLSGDTIVMGAEPYNDYEDVELKEMILGRHNAWVGKRLKDIDISRQTLVVMVRRGDHILTPKGRLVFQEGDKVILYSKQEVVDETQD